MEKGQRHRLRQRPGTTVTNGKLLVIGRQSNNSLWLHQNALSISTPDNPYSGTSWQANAVQVPALPSGWAAAGDPVIANTVPLTGVVTLMTRARSGSINRLYYLYWDGTAFSDGVNANTWIRLPTGTTTISSDPSLEVAIGPPQINLMTVFIRGATNNEGTVTNPNRIFQASGIGANLWETFTLVRPEQADTFVDSPAAVGGSNFEGRHLVVAKKSNNQFYFWNPAPF